MDEPVASVSGNRHAGYPPIEDIDEALHLWLHDEAAHPSPHLPAVFTVLTEPPWEAWLSAHPDLPRLRVRCGACGYHMGHWKMDRATSVANPDLPLQNRPGEIQNFTSRVAAGNGPVIDSFGHDAKGPVKYKCRRRGCGKVVSLSPERRAILYLLALRNNETEVKLVESG